MYGQWRDFEHAFDLLDQMRNNFDRTFGELEPYRGHAGGNPPTNVYDTGSSFLVVQEVPGLGEKDLDITLNQDVLSIRGERKVQVPEGYSVHRRERRPATFARSIALPAKVDPEKVKATVNSGVLRVELEKAREVQPRQITVKAS